MLNVRSSRAQVGASQPGLARPPRDLLVTDPAATRALLQVETFDGPIWESACGPGVMADVLREPRVDPRTGLKVQNMVLATDISCDPSVGVTGCDFLKVNLKPAEVRNIVTNPPYELGEEFVLHALGWWQVGNVDKVAMLLRLAWLEGSGRRDRVWRKYPFSRCWVFSKRALFQRNGEGEFQSGLIAFAWFVWDRAAMGDRRVGWI